MLVRLVRDGFGRRGFCGAAARKGSGDAAATVVSMVAASRAAPAAKVR